MAEQQCMFDFNIKQLIELKHKRLTEVEQKYFEVISRETDIKNIESKLYLETDFKEIGLTNEKMRTSYVTNHTHEARLKLDLAKFELKQQENALVVINDLIKFRLSELEAQQ